MSEIKFGFGGVARRQRHAYNLLDLLQVQLDSPPSENSILPCTQTFRGVQGVPTLIHTLASTKPCQGLAAVGGTLDECTGLVSWVTTTLRMYAASRVLEYTAIER